MPETRLIVAVATVLIACIGFLARADSSPDGVSYIDLAAALHRGELAQFTQEYWSPLLPALLGVISLVLDLADNKLVEVAHLLNVVWAIGALIILWCWARQLGDGMFAREAIAAYLLAGWGFPKIEAVTPDVLLLTVSVWLSYELIIHRGQRWLLTGLLFSLAFLVKTSSWPWLLFLVPIRLLVARDRGARSAVVQSTAVGLAVSLIWIVPMSLRAHHVTPGSAGRLNYSWYLLDNTSRLPDTDQGANRAYRAHLLPTGDTIEVATFSDAERWTYQPWGDPTAWESNVLTQTGHAPARGRLLAYWGRNLWLVFGLWSFPLLVSVLVPLLVRVYRPGIVREAWTREPDAAMVALAGVVGLMQFAVVHAEPRLIAPFGMMVALGVISCLRFPTVIRSRSVTMLSLGWVGLIVALGFGIETTGRAIQSNRATANVAVQLAAAEGQLRKSGGSMERVGVIGPAAPIVAAARSVNAHIAVQILPRSIGALAKLSPAQARQAMLAVFGGRVSTVWQTLRDGTFQVLIVPAPAGGLAGAGR